MRTTGNRKMRTSCQTFVCQCARCLHLSACVNPMLDTHFLELFCAALINLLYIGDLLLFFPLTSFVMVSKLHVASFFACVKVLVCHHVCVRESDRILHFPLCKVYVIFCQCVIYILGSNLLFCKVCP